MRKRLALAVPLALALTGCATTRYVQTYCVTRAQFEELKVRQPPKVRAQLNGQADHDLKIIAANDLRMRAYADGLLVVLDGCVDPNK